MGRKGITTMGKRIMVMNFNYGENSGNGQLPWYNFYWNNP